MNNTITACLEHSDDADGTSMTIRYGGGPLDPLSAGDGISLLIAENFTSGLRYEYSEETEGNLLNAVIDGPDQPRK